MWTYDERAPERERERETACALGNGYVVTRGAAEEYAAGDHHYPGTYLAGGYDRAVSDADGHPARSESLVNWPNWLPLTFRPADGDWLDPDRWAVLEHRWSLDLHRGVLVRRLRVRDPAGRVTALRSRRLVHMGARNLLALEWELTPENWSGTIVVRSALDGTVANAAGRTRDGRRDPRAVRHVRTVHTGASGDGVLELVAQGVQSRLAVAYAARLRAYGDGGRELRAERWVIEQPDAIAEELQLAGGPGRTVRLEKVVAVFSSRDHAVGEPLLEARRLAVRAPGFGELLRTQMLAWKRLWSRCDVEVVAPQGTQRLLRFHLFHLLQSTSPHAADLDVGVPPRGWHGEGSRGLVSWDELFVLPLLQHALPEVVRAVLMYRVRRLGEARARAEELGLRGAVYPWQSGSSGREEAPAQRQLHVSSAVARNVWQYWQATGDLEFLSLHGAEVVLEVARAWASLAVHDAAQDRWRVRGVVGPDRFHAPPAGAATPGLDDECYTTLLAAWALQCAEDVLALLPRDRRDELRDQLELGDAELAHWQRVGRRLHVPWLDEFPAPYTGWDALPELDWTSYAARFGELHHLDRILAHEGDSAARYRVASLPGLVALLYLFGPAELGALLARLGYELDEAAAERAARFYLDRTAPGSALARALQLWVRARADRERSWPLLDAALRGGGSPIPPAVADDGVHLGAMAVVVDVVRRGWLGLELRDGRLWLDPQLPPEVESVCTRLRHRGASLEVRVDRGALSLTLREGSPLPVQVGVGDTLHELATGEVRTIALAPAATRAPGAQGAPA